jgi:hypothetical protein
MDLNLRDEMIMAAQAETQAVRAHLAAKASYETLAEQGNPLAGLTASFDIERTRIELSHAQDDYRNARAAFEAAF